VGATVDKVVLRHLQVERSRALADATSGIVVRAVAGAEVTTGEGTGVGDRDTTQVCADSGCNAELRHLREATLFPGLGISETSSLVRLKGFHDVRGTLADEHGLATPLGNEHLTLIDVSKVDLSGRHTKGGSAGSKSSQALEDGHVTHRSKDESGDSSDQVCSCTTSRVHLSVGHAVIVNVVVPTTKVVNHTIGGHSVDDGSFAVRCGRRNL